MTKTAHRQNGPNEGRKRPTQTKTAPTKTAPMEEKTRPKRPQLTSKTARSHVQNGPLRNIVQISDNDVINLNAHVAFRINASMPPPSSRHIAYDGHEKPTPLFPVEALRSRHERTPTMQLQPFHRRI